MLGQPRNEPGQLGLGLGLGSGGAQQDPQSEEVALPARRLAFQELGGEESQGADDLSLPGW